MIVFFRVRLHRCIRTLFLRLSIVSVLLILTCFFFSSLLRDFFYAIYTRVMRGEKSIIKIKQASPQ